MSDSIETADVEEILKTINYPGLNRDIMSFGFVDEISVDGGEVYVEFNPSTDREDIINQIRDEINEQVGTLDGVSSVTVETTESADADQTGDGSPQPPGGGGEPEIQDGRVAAAAPGATTEPGQGPMDRQRIPGVKKIIAVASGKGGVGKSTVAVNLAAALDEQGHSVALADMDIYGPSAPTMMGVKGRPRVTEDDNILPLEAGDIKTMSIGFVLDETEPVVWRGPMVMKAVTQFLRDVQWGERDVMVVDLPPGTGDAQLTLMQKVPLSGAVIVTTPQDVALIDAQKGVEMFRKLDVPILGIVENMSSYECPDCGHEEDIFGSGGGRKEAMRLNVSFLGGIPIDPRIRQGGDEGESIVSRVPDAEASQVFLDIAEQVESDAQHVDEVLEDSEAEASA